MGAPELSHESAASPAVARASGPLLRLDLEVFYCIVIAAVVGLFVLTVVTKPSEDGSGASKPAEPAKGTLAIGCSTRPRKAGDGGLVLILKNNSNVDLKNAFVIAVDPVTSASSKMPVETWLNGQTVEFGENNDWKVTTGQLLVIGAPGYPLLHLTLQ